MKRKRARYEGYISDVAAFCQTCDKEWHTKHAHGVGVRHANAHGHNVFIRKITEFYYIGDQATSPFKRNVR